MSSQQQHVATAATIFYAVLYSNKILSFGCLSNALLFLAANTAILQSLFSNQAAIAFRAARYSKISPVLYLASNNLSCCPSQHSYLVLSTQQFIFRLFMLPLCSNYFLLYFCTSCNNYLSLHLITLLYAVIIYVMSVQQLFSLLVSCNATLSRVLFLCAIIVHGITCFLIHNFLNLFCYHFAQASFRAVWWSIKY